MVSGPKTIEQALVPMVARPKTIVKPLIPMDVFQTFIHKIEITRLRVGVGAVKTIKKNISYVQRTKMSHFAFSVGKQFPRGEFMRPRSCLLCY